MQFATLGSGRLFLCPLSLELAPACASFEYFSAGYRPLVPALALYWLHENYNLYAPSVLHENYNNCEVVKVRSAVRDPGIWQAYFLPAISNWLLRVRLCHFYVGYRLPVTAQLILEVANVPSGSLGVCFYGVLSKSWWCLTAIPYFFLLCPYMGAVRSHVA